MVGECVGLLVGDAVGIINWCSVRLPAVLDGSFVGAFEGLFVGVKW